MCCVVKDKLSLFVFPFIIHRTCLATTVVASSFAAVTYRHPSSFAVIAFYVAASFTTSASSATATSSTAVSSTAVTSWLGSTALHQLIASPFAGSQPTAVRPFTAISCLSFAFSSAFVSDVASSFSSDVHWPSVRLSRPYPWAHPFASAWITGSASPALNASISLAASYSYAASTV